MKKILSSFLLLTFLSTSLMADDNGTRLKDIVTVKGVRENPIVGYGLVIGLNGTGDSGGEITNLSLKKMFEKLGLNPKSEVTSKNVASVIVTAKLPAFARVGQKLDLVVSSIGDASSLAGGTLLITPLKGGDDNVYAVASGQLSIGGLTQGAKFATTATIPNGASVEKEIMSDFDKKNALRLSLKNPDFTTAARVEKVINEELGGKYASAKDSATIDLIVPPNYERNIVSLLAIIENFRVHTDSSAKIVFNERTGTLVAGGDVIVKPVAISHGDLTIEIKSEDNKTSEKGSVYYMDKGTKLSDLVKGLNAFGVTSQDLISIFQALKKDGALVGDLETI